MKCFQVFLFHLFFFVVNICLCDNKEIKREKLDYPIITLKIKNNDISTNIYFSDIVNKKTFIKMTTNEEKSNSEVVEILFKNKLVCLFQKALPKEIKKQMEKQIDIQVKEQIKMILDQCKGDISILEKQIGLSIDEYEEQIRRFHEENFLFNLFFDNKIGDINVSIDDVKKYYKNLLDKNMLDEKPETYDFYEIEIRKHNFDKANKIFSQIKKTGNFNSVFKKNKKDEEIKFGEISGNYNDHIALFTKDIKKNIFYMKNNEISNIIQTYKGLFILKKIKQNKQWFLCKYFFFPDSKYKNFNKDVEVFIKSLKKKIIEQPDKEYAFESLIDYFKKNNSFLFDCSFDKKQNVVLNPKMKKYLSKLKVGDFSEPIFSKEGPSRNCKMFYILKKTEKHLENIDNDFNSLKNKTKKHIKQEKITFFIKQLMKQVDITYDDKIDFCVEMFKKYEKK